MTGYLLDASAIWWLFRDLDTFLAWESERESGALRVCEPTRAEFLFSAMSSAHRDEIAAHLDALCDLAPVPKSAWRWVDTAQYKLTQRGQHRAAGVVDLLVCATAAHHGLTVLHTDNDVADFAAVARVLPELSERDIRH